MFIKLQGLEQKLKQSNYLIEASKFYEQGVGITLDILHCGALDPSATVLALSIFCDSCSFSSFEFRPLAGKKIFGCIGFQYGGGGRGLSNFQSSIIGRRRAATEKKRPWNNNKQQQEAKNRHLI